jgi:hypothetical protein
MFVEQEFHQENKNEKKEKPSHALLLLFSIQAKGYYLKTGLRKMMKKGGLKDFTRDIILEVDNRRVDLPSLEGIVIMNILR